MTFKEAIYRLDGDATLATKRPSMRGYVFAQSNTEVDEEGNEKVVDVSVHICAKNPAEETVVVFDPAVGRIKDGKIEMTPEQITAFVFADDWEIANRAELEKSRVGEGEM